MYDQLCMQAYKSGSHLPLYHHQTELVHGVLHGYPTDSTSSYSVWRESRKKRIVLQRTRIRRSIQIQSCARLSCIHFDAVVRLSRSSRCECRCCSADPSNTRRRHKEAAMDRQPLKGANISQPRSAQVDRKQHR